MAIKDGKTWLKLSISIWNDAKTKEEKKYKHPASFPASIPSKLINIYTEENEEVIDPFMGIGSTLEAASSLNRRSVGFEINREYIEIAKDRLKTYDLRLYRIFDCSCLELEEQISLESVDFCVTSPPYWDILRQKRTSDKKVSIDYGDDSRNLENITDYRQFIAEMKTVFTKVYNILRPSKHCVLVLQDIRKKKNFYTYHMDMIECMNKIGFTLEDIIIWDRRKDYNNLRPLGYPYVFRVNKVHEYIMIFKK